MEKIRNLTHMFYIDIADSARQDEIHYEQEYVGIDAGILAYFPDCLVSESEGNGKAAQDGEDVEIGIYKVDNRVGSGE